MLLCPAVGPKGKQQPHVVLTHAQDTLRKMIYKLMEKIDNKVMHNDTGAHQFSDTGP